MRKYFFAASAVALFLFVIYGCALFCQRSRQLSVARVAQAQKSILIQKALLLNAAGQVIDDITQQVIVKDDKWVNIPAGATIRVTFSEALDKDQDITLFAKAVTDQSPQVSVYSPDQDSAIAQFKDIIEADTYKVLLSNLTRRGATFDLRVTGADLSLDWLVDPAFAIVKTAGMLSTDGASPDDDQLILSGSTLYGMTRQGGSLNKGTIFSVNIDGSSYTVLHDFTGGTSDGDSPYGFLTISGSTLYGTTFAGGSSNFGTIFSITTSGTGFTILHSFTGTTSDGQEPYGSLLLSGSTLYGTTNAGGSNSLGTVFSMATNGTAFTILHSFAGGGTDGQDPRGALILDGSTLYGTTFAGGSSDSGTIFSIGIDGSAHTILHEFTGAADDGSAPYGQLTISGSTLYGMTNTGGSSSRGTIFSIGTDGNGFAVLHSFVGGTSDGRAPYGQLTISGSTLYGMTNLGGTSNLGTIFSITTSGTSFTLLHSFVAGSSDGSRPKGSLILSGSTLYGMTNLGGLSSVGTVFSISTAGSSFTLLHNFAGNIFDGKNYYGFLTLSGSKLYGMSKLGSRYALGTIFSVNTDGSSYTVLHDFAGGSSDGSSPQGSLILSGSTLYGMTLSGGSSSRGTIFSIGTDGSNFTLLHTFVGGTSDGRSPYGSLILSGSTLYGMTSLGGTSNLGTVFSISTAGTGFAILHSFTGNPDGSSPKGSLILSGSTLYGMANTGGSSDSGTIFSIGTDGSNFSLLHTFTGTTSDGQEPYDSLILSGSTLYGLTNAGGTDTLGTIFSIGTDGSSFNLLHSFTGDDGQEPRGSLTLAGSTLYGMTMGGGSSGKGTIFSIGTDGSNYTVVHNFTGGSSDGSGPQGSLITSPSALYGSSVLGGYFNAGAIFSYAVDLSAPSIYSLSPANNATGVSASANLVITFDENVTVGTGNILIKKVGDDTTAATIAVGSGQVTGSTTDTITISPTSDLSNETAYYIQIPGTAFSDSSGNFFAGISDATTWTFTTPTCDTIAHASTYNAYPTCGVATCSSGYTLVDGSCVVPSCDAVANAYTYNAYPTCGVATCLAGYVLTNGSCVRSNTGFSVNSAFASIFNTASFAVNNSVVGSILNKIGIGLFRPASTIGGTAQSGNHNTQIGVGFFKSQTVLDGQVKNQPIKTGFNFQADLSAGMITDDVLVLQKYLNQQGFLVDSTGPGSPGQETNKFGALTRSALIRFQLAHGINPARGYFGPLTRDFINQRAD